MDNQYPAGSLLNNENFIQSCKAFTQIRQDIHRYPELGADVPRTARLVAECLQEWGYETHTGVGGLGVVGVLRRGDGKKSIGIRADMDALPVREETGLSYASEIVGRMHACGHDGHTAILLAAAHYLARYGNYNGTLNLIFQPDEEGLGGAKAMLEDGLFERFPCDVIFALHNMPGKEAGNAVVKTGPMLASSDVATIRLTGKGGHAALPHLARDVTVALAGIIMALQSIVSRNLSPLDTAVVTIGQISAGHTTNVIPEEAVMTLSVRNVTAESRNFVEQKINDIVAFQCRAYGVEGRVEYQRLVPVLINHPEQTLLARHAVSQVLGEQNVQGDEAEMMMGSEDFASMLEARPGCYFILSNGVGQWYGCSVHNPGYDFNDRLIPIGAACWVQLVSNYLSQD